MGCTISFQVTGRVAGAPGVHSHSVRSLATVIKETRLVQENAITPLVWAMATTVEDLLSKHKNVQLPLRIVLV